jgi:hypothetical protein
MVDFEFGTDVDGLPVPVCLVAWELKSGRKIRLWRDEFGEVPPYPVDETTLFVAYYASAELGCHLALGWPLPERVLDLYVEFRNLTNGLPTVAGNGLLGALTYYGLDGIDAAEKDDMRRLILSGGAWSEQETKAILEYCQSDVAALNKLLPVMVAKLDLPRALLRGRFMAAAARMERNGIPLDAELFMRLKRCWLAIQERLIAAVDRDYGIYDGRTFKQDKFDAWLAQQGIPWPRLPTGKLDLRDDTFREMARAYPCIAPLHELRATLSQLRLMELAVGLDARSRTVLWAFKSKTGRNQPSNKKFVFGPATWLRGLIKPPPGYAVAYIDWEQQEFGIAAALSGDANMLEAYVSGDPYLAFAKQADAVPPHATKATHAAEREQFKQCSLAVQYGMGANSLAQRIGQPTWRGRELLSLHRSTYSTFWTWSDASVDCAMLTGALPTVFGWTLHIDTKPNERSVRNFPMQANGAEMLRLALCMATEEGLEVCAPIHDAVLIAAPLDKIEADVARMQEIMAEASRIVLGGFALRSEAKIVRAPNRYMDKRGQRMWDVILGILDELEAAETCAPQATPDLDGCAPRATPHLSSSL